MNRQFSSCWSLFSKAYVMMDFKLGHKSGQGEEGRKGIARGLLVILVGSTSGQLLESEPSTEAPSSSSKQIPFRKLERSGLICHNATFNLSSLDFSDKGHFQWRPLGSKSDGVLRAMLVGQRNPTFNLTMSLLASTISTTYLWSRSRVPLL